MNTTLNANQAEPVAPVSRTGWKERCRSGVKVSRTQSLMQQMPAYEHYGKMCRDAMCCDWDSTRHTVTGKTLTELLWNYTTRTKLPGVKDIEAVPPEHSEAGDHDLTSRFKEKGRDRMPGAEPSHLRFGYVTQLMENTLLQNKLDAPFLNTRLEVTDKRSSNVTAVD